jgi:hypothetical protein
MSFQLLIKKFILYFFWFISCKIQKIIKRIILLLLNNKIKENIEKNK